MYQERPREGKRHLSVRSEAQAMSIERRAFVAGKDAGQRASDPFPPAGWAAFGKAWLRGWTYAANLVNGKRPLDTARRLP